MMRGRLFTYVALTASTLLLCVGCPDGNSGTGNDWDVGFDGGTDTGNESDRDTDRPERRPPDKPDGVGDGTAPGNPKVDLYFVVDGDGSEKYVNQVESFLGTYADQIALSDLKHQFGFTNMHVDNEGRLLDPPGWHFSKPKLLGALEDGATDCTSRPGWKCPASAAHGLEVARKGIRYMSTSTGPQPASRDALRDDARLVVIFLTNDAPASVEGETDTESYLSFFRDRATVFAVKTRDDCATSATTGAYKTIATETGGKYVNDCAEDLSLVAERFALSVEPESR